MGSMCLGINEIEFRIFSIRTFNLKFDELISREVGINHDLFPLIAECFERFTVWNSGRPIFYLDLIRGLSIHVLGLWPKSRTSPSGTSPSAGRARRY
jgi:hypothetical protein